MRAMNHHTTIAASIRQKAMTDPGVPDHFTNDAVMENANTAPATASTPGVLLRCTTQLCQDDASDATHRQPVLSGDCVAQDLDTRVRPASAPKRHQQTAGRPT